MFGRLDRHVVMLIVGCALLACGGDDKDASSESASSSGGSGARASGSDSTTAGEGSSGSSASGGRGARGAAGRGGFGRQMCPMTEAEATGACTPARGNCTFDMHVCACSAETMMWACWAPTDCPTSTPAERSSCSVVGMSCSPARGQNCSCTAQGWDCGNQYCPPDEPTAGGMCDGGNGACTYGERRCDCNSGSQWTCWSPKTDCPAAAPADRAACSMEGMSCDYQGGSCDCRGMRGWRCGRGVMREAESDDAGMPMSMGGHGGVAGGAGMSAAGATSGGQGGASGSSAGTSGSAGSK